MAQLQIYQLAKIGDVHLIFHLRRPPSWDKDPPNNSAGLVCRVIIISQDVVVVDLPWGDSSSLQDILYKVYMKSLHHSENYSVHSGSVVCLIRDIELLQNDDDIHESTELTKEIYSDQVLHFHDFLHVSPPFPPQERLFQSHFSWFPLNYLIYSSNAKSLKLLTAFAT